MYKVILPSITIALFAAACGFAQGEAEDPATPDSVVAESSAEEWTAIPPEDLLVMDLAPDLAGKSRTVVIQLIPAPFSQPWVANIRALAGEHWWDGTSVYRVQDNYVAQWGDVTEEKPLPEGVVSPSGCYSQHGSLGPARPGCASELLDGPLASFSAMAEDSDPLTEWRMRDPTSMWADFLTGWPIASSRMPESGEWEAWPTHCYGTIGVARDYAPDTGTGAELFVIIGQPQRHMDRNLAVVGRVIEGMEHLSSLPRGSGDLGFYTDEEAHLRVPIVSVRLASDLDDAPSFEYLDTASESFARYVAVRANRNDPFYTVPAGGVDVCSVEVPVRRVAQ